jgi:hypothetical protein
VRRFPIGSDPAGLFLDSCIWLFGSAFSDAFWLALRGGLVGGCLFLSLGDGLAGGWDARAALLRGLWGFCGGCWLVLVPVGWRPLGWAGRCCGFRVWDGALRGLVHRVFWA